MDETDRKILEILRENARKPAAEIAMKLNIPDRTVLKRIKKMQDDGIIIQYITRCNFKKIGMDILAYILIDADYIFLKRNGRTQSDLAEELARRFPYCSDVVTVTGAADIIMKVRVKNLTMMNRLAENIRAVEGVLRTTTMTTLHEVKKPMIRGKLPPLKVKRKSAEPWRHISEIQAQIREEEMAEA